MVGLDAWGGEEPIKPTHKGVIYVPDLRNKYPQTVVLETAATLRPMTLVLFILDYLS